MTPEMNQPGAGDPATVGGIKKTSIGWQLLQIAALAALLIAGMYEVDLDARALAEKRARSALLLAVEEAAGRRPPAGLDPELERAVEAYAKVCEDCATVERCQEAIRSIRVEKRNLAGRGPCKPALFDRGSSDEAATRARTP